MQKIIHNLKWLTLSIVMGIILGGGLITIKAWTEPTVAPPGGNIGAPINTSINPQAKIGGLQVNGFRNLGTTVLDGNVGIGTTNPLYKLHVEGGLQANGFSSIGDIAVGRPQSIYGSTHRQFILHGAWNNLYIAPRNDANTDWLWDRFVITSGGNVGIGTTSPGQKLDVAGNIRTNSQIRSNQYCDADGNNCKAITAMGGGTPSVHVYQCPFGTAGWNPGGAWGSYGCQGQISTVGFCLNIEYPAQQYLTCTYLGTLRIN